MPKPKLLIAYDCGPEIGYGHKVRSECLAIEMRKYFEVHIEKTNILQSVSRFDAALYDVPGDVKNFFSYPVFYQKLECSAQDSPIRPEFLETRKNYKIHSKVKRIFIGMGGGTDSFFRVRRAMSLMYYIDPDICIIDVTGNIYTGKHINKMLLLSDIAITNGGSMMLEAMCVGVPTLSWPGNEEEGHVRSEGNIDRLSEDNLRLMFDYDMRKFKSNEHKCIIDGKGSERIAKQFWEDYNKWLMG